jgi:cold shock CspA family protein
MNEKNEIQKDLNKQLLDQTTFETNVHWFESKIGFGFLITPPEAIEKIKNLFPNMNEIELKDAEDIYVHHTDIQATGYRQLSPTQKVSFQIGKSWKRQHGQERWAPCALNVIPLEEFGDAKARYLAQKTPPKS